MRHNPLGAAFISVRKWDWVRSFIFTVAASAPSHAVGRYSFRTRRRDRPNPSATITADAQGRYVRVQLSMAGYLSLAEVQVFGQ
jgi:hypothetical protein